LYLLMPILVFGAPQEGHGKVSLETLQEFSAKYGGGSLNDTDLQSMFGDMQPTDNGLVNLQQFYIFFSKVSRTMSNSQFDELIKDLMS
jgi:hypothetical protein